MKTPLSSLRPMLNQAVKDIPFGHLEVTYLGTIPDKEIGRGIRSECTFEPFALAKSVIPASTLRKYKNLWGWGLIETWIIPDEKGNDQLEITGIFDVADKDNWRENRLYSEERAFFGEYDIETHTWSFDFGR